MSGGPTESRVIRYR